MRVAASFVMLGFAIASAADLSAQKYRYSPNDARTKASGRGNTLPFGFFGTARYQQVHGDLTGSAVRVTHLSLRRAAINRDISTMVGRTVDVELTMAHSDFAKSTTTFDNNLKALGKTVAIKRKKIVFPNIAKYTGPLPPWNVDLKFDKTWLYLGKDDLAWDLKMFSTTSTSTYFLDFSTSKESGTATDYGTGCLASGQRERMLMMQFVIAQWGSKLQLQWRILNGPKNKTSPSVIFAAGAKSQILVPGLCTRLHVITPALVLAGNTTGADGIFQTPQFSLAWDRSFVGLELHTQGFSYDPTQKGLPWAGTQGIETRIEGPVRRIWSSNPNATTGSSDQFGNHGLAVRMQHQ